MPSNEGNIFANVRRHSSHKFEELNMKKENVNYPTATRLGLSPSKARLEMVASEPFFGQVLMCLDIMETSQPDMPTAAVYWNDKKLRFGMMYDKELFAWLTADQQKAIFTHEFLHIIFGHLTTRGAQKGASEEERKIWNIAMDLAINSYVNNLPHNIIFPHLAAKQLEAETKAKEFAEQLKEFMKDNKGETFTGANGETLTGEEILEKIKESEAAQAEAKEKRIEGHGQRPPGLLSLVMPGDGIFKAYPPYLTSEQYWELIMSDPKMKQQIAEQYGSGKSLFDGHGEEGEGQGDEEAKGEDEGEGEGKKKPQNFSQASKQAEAKRIAERCRNNSEKKGWGTASSNLSEYINSLLEQTIDWRAALRYFIMKSKRGSKYSTYRRTNRRIRNEAGESLAPGRKTTRTSSVLVATDESGSVSDNLMAEFIAELNGLSRYVEFTMIPFDTSCGEPWKWEKGKTIRIVERTKTGGTDFNAPTKYFNAHKEFDGLIILTDMYAPTPGPSRTTRIWVTNTDKEYSESVAGNEPVIYIDAD